PGPGPRPARARGGGGDSGTAFSVEGELGPARVQALAQAGATLLVAENPRTVRLSGALLTRLDRLGIRLLSLEPIEVAGIVASSTLARSRSRWKDLFPARTRVWIRKSR